MYYLCLSNVFSETISSLPPHLNEEEFGASRLSRRQIHGADDNDESNEDGEDETRGWER